MVDGKVDSRGAEPKVLVDHITTELDHVIPLQTYNRPRAGQAQSGGGNSPLNQTPNLHPPPPG